MCKSALLRSVAESYCMTGPDPALITVLPAPFLPAATVAAACSFVGRLSARHPGLLTALHEQGYPVAALGCLARALPAADMCSFTLPIASWPLLLGGRWPSASGMTFIDNFLRLWTARRRSTSHGHSCSDGESGRGSLPVRVELHEDTRRILFQ